MSDAPTYYIEQWQHRLGLDAWDIRYNPDRKVSKLSLANNTNTEGLLICEIGIQKGCPDEEIEGCVVHEMVHLLVNPIVDKAIALAGTVGNEAISMMLMDEYHEMRENLIEQLTRVLLGRKTKPFGKALGKEFSSFLDAA